MADTNRELVVLMTRGTDHELSSVGFTIANGAITAGMKVYAFLTSSAVDLVRKRAVDTTQVAPLEPLKSLVDDFIRRGGTVIATGRNASVRDFCRIAFEHAGLDYEKYVEIDPALFRRAEIDAVLGSAAKARAKLGWTPKTSLEQLVVMMVDAELARLKKGASQ